MSTPATRAHLHVLEEGDVEIRTHRAPERESRRGHNMTRSQAVAMGRNGRKNGPKAGRRRNPGHPKRKKVIYFPEDFE